MRVLRRTWSLGSSPLTRGKHLHLTVRKFWAGLIPAHAGKTWQRKQMPSPSGGSSPLTRGKHIIKAQLQKRLGLIPAHAGKTPDFHLAV